MSSLFGFCTRFLNSNGSKINSNKNTIKPNLTILEDRMVPATSLVFNPDLGSPAHIRVFNPTDLSTHKDFYAFNPQYTGGVVTSNITFNAREYVAVAALQNTHIKIFDITENPKEIASYYAFKGYNGEINIKLIQNSLGNGIDLIASPKSGSNHIKIIDALTGTVKDQYYAYKFAKTTPVGIDIAPCGSTLTTSLIITPHSAGFPVLIKDLATGDTRQFALPAGFKPSDEGISDPDNNGKYFLQIKGSYSKSPNDNNFSILINLESLKIITNNGVFKNGNLISTIGYSYSVFDVGNGNKSIFSSSGQDQNLRPFGGYAGKIFVGSSFETFDNWAKFSTSFTTKEIDKIGSIQSKFIKVPTGYNLINSNGSTFVDQTGNTNTIAGSFNNLWKVNSDIGLPVTEAQITSTKDHWFQRFENGILSGPTDYALYPLKGEMYLGWKKLFEAGYDIGVPTSIIYGKTDKLQQFENGCISISNSGDPTFYRGYNLGDLSNLPEQDFYETSVSNYSAIRNVEDFDTNAPALNFTGVLGKVYNSTVATVTNPLGTVREGLKEASEIWTKIQSAFENPKKAFEETFKVQPPHRSLKDPASKYFTDILTSDIKTEVGGKKGIYSTIKKTDINYSITGYADINGTVKEFKDYDQTKMQFWDTRLDNPPNTESRWANWKGLPESIKNDNIVTTSEIANMVIDIQSSLKALSIGKTSLSNKDTYLSFLAQPLTRMPWVFSISVDTTTNPAGGINYGTHYSVREIVIFNNGILKSAESNLIEIFIPRQNFTTNIYTLAHEMGHSMGHEGYFTNTTGSKEYLGLKLIWDKFASLSQHANANTGTMAEVDPYYLSHWMDFADGYEDIKKPTGEKGEKAAYGYGSVNEDFPEFVAEIYRHKDDFNDYRAKSSATKQQKIDCVLQMINLMYPDSIGKTPQNISVRSTYSITNPNDILPK